MQMIPFYKYQGTGNDFILVDNREKGFPTQDYEHIRKLCHRRFGIGADGLMVLEHAENADFHMLYYNSDGLPGTMCGNGGRCIVAFAHFLGLFDTHCSFLAPDGLHEAEWSVKDGQDWVALGMSPVKGIEEFGEDLVLDTGSPHYVKRVEQLDELDVRTEGKAIRNSNPFQANGINVNFVQEKQGSFYLRTYERGVEDETYACGTGTVATALALNHWGIIKGGQGIFQVKGGTLEVKFNRIAEGEYDQIELIGPAKMVFKGKLPDHV